MWNIKKTELYLEGLLHEIGLIHITNKLHHRKYFVRILYTRCKTSETDSFATLTRSLLKFCDSWIKIRTAHFLWSNLFVFTLHEICQWKVARNETYIFVLLKPKTFGMNHRFACIKFVCIIFAHWCVTRHSHFPLSLKLETWLGKPTPKQTFFRKVIFWKHYFWMRSKLMKDFKFLCPFNNINISPVSGLEILPREIFFGGK